MLDGTKDMVDIKDDTANYFAEDFDNMIDKINEVIDKNIEENTVLKAATYYVDGINIIIPSPNNYSFQFNRKP